MALPAFLLPLLAQVAGGAAAGGGAAGGAAAGGAEAAGGMAGGTALSSLAGNTQGWLSGGSLQQPQAPAKPQEKPKKAWEQPPIPYEPAPISHLTMSPNPAMSEGQDWGFLKHYLGGSR